MFALVAGAAIATAPVWTPAAASGTRASATGPHLLAVVPQDGALLQRAPQAVRLTFASPLDPRRSHVEVVSDAMILVNSASTVTGARHDTLSSPLHALQPGPYAVVWTAVGTNGATVRRSYLFTVAPLGPPLFPARPVSSTRHLGSLVVRFSVPSDRVGHLTYTIALSANGYPVAGATVTLVGRSLDMDMGEAPATTHALGAGRYVGVGDVVMAGAWQVAVEVRRGGAVWRTTFTYSAHY